MRRLHVTISGRVQGVFFRASTVDEARGLLLKGWVKNLPDGRVEAVAEGQHEKLVQFLAWCRKGPPRAHVTNIDESWEEATGEFSQFSVI